MKLCECDACKTRRRLEREKERQEMERYNTKEMAGNIIKTFKTGFKDVSIVPAKKKKCSVCSKFSRKSYELRVRGRNPLHKGYTGYIGRGVHEIFVGRRKKVFKHLANVCSKECEMMLCLAVG